jgi:hypothetical protein
LKSCTGTAVLLSAAGLARQDKITWRYTTVATATSPAAVPVIVDNDLARGVPSIQDAGGIDTVIDAGLLHTAATEWNDAQPKCPILKVIVQQFKEKTQDFCREWKDDKTVHPPRKVLDVQYLRVGNNQNTTESSSSPWDIHELSPKFNVTIDLLQPTKYLTPRRSGQFHCKLPGAPGNIAFRTQLEITCEHGSVNAYGNQDKWDVIPSFSSYHRPHWQALSKMCVANLSSPMMECHLVPFSRYWPM